MRRQRGFTLIELLVVLVIIAVVVVGVSLSIRDTNRDLLEKDAQRLIAQLEAARSVSRTSGVAWVWQAQDAGYVIQPLPASPDTAILQTHWYSPELVSHTNTADGRLILGPEPLMTPASIDLQITTGNNTTHLQIATDGLHGFEVRR
jgi:type II secretion system protein H